MGVCTIENLQQMQSVRLGPDSIGRRQEFNLEETALGPHDDQARFAAVDAARSPRVPRYGIKASARKLYRPPAYYAAYPFIQGHRLHIRTG